MNGDIVPGRISVVTPTLNAAAYLRETIASVLAQSYADVEYLLVDGGSNDATLAIAAQAGDRLQVVELIPSSQAQAIAAGFARATGEFYAFLNADDTLEPRALELLLSELQAAPDAPFAYGEALFVDEGGRPLRAYPTLPFDLRALAQTCFICQPATLIRARAYAAAGGVDAAYEAAFDYDLWFRLARLGAPAFAPVLCARSRMHRDSKSHVSRHANLREICAIVRRNAGYVPFSWVHAYAGVLATGGDLFFDPPAGSPARTLLTLLLGWQINARHGLRFTSEFFDEVRRLRAAK